MDPIRKHLVTRNCIYYTALTCLRIAALRDCTIADKNANGTGGTNRAD